MNSCCKDKPNKIMNKLGGWSFQPELYEFIVFNLPKGSTIFELGSGYGTGLLSNDYIMYSVEHNIKFVNAYNSNYIFAPMKGYWYDRNVVDRHKPANYDLILVDGPIGSDSKNRIGFFENIDLFDTSKMMIFDDTNREGEMILFKKVLGLFPDRKFEHFKTFSVIY